MLNGNDIDSVLCGVEQILSKSWDRTEIRNAVLNSMNTVYKKEIDVFVDFICDVLGVNDKCVRKALL